MDKDIESFFSDCNDLLKALSKLCENFIQTEDDQVRATAACLQSIKILYHIFIDEKAKQTGYEPKDIMKSDMNDYVTSIKLKYGNKIFDPSNQD